MPALTNCDGGDARRTNAKTMVSAFVRAVDGRLTLIPQRCTTLIYISDEAEPTVGQPHYQAAGKRSAARKFRTNVEKRQAGTFLFFSPLLQLDRKGSAGVNAFSES